MFLELGDGRLRILAQGVGEGADIADGERARGKLVEPHLLDGGQIGPADAGGRSDVFKSQGPGLAKRPERLPKTGAFAEKSHDPLLTPSLALGDRHDGVRNRAGIPWHGYRPPRTIKPQNAPAATPHR